MSINNEVNNALDNIDLEAAVQAAVKDWLSNNDEWLQSIVQPIVKSIQTSAALEVRALTEQTESLVSESVRKKLAKFDDTASKALQDNFAKRLKQYDFPDESVPLKAIRFDKATLSGDRIAGGIIRSFNSTGIQDTATDCRVTIMDDNTIFENQLVSAGLRVVGPTSLEGTVSIAEVDKASGFYQTLCADVSDRVNQSLNSDLFDNFNNRVFERIAAEGLDVTKLRSNDALILDNATLTSAVQFSKLKSVGVLKELEVAGELSVYGSSLYVGKKRLGINTIEPSATVSIWDDEVEFEIAKLKENTGFIGLPRKQELTIGVNDKDNIVLQTDGTTYVKRLRLGAMTFESAPQPPNYEGDLGQVVFNAKPNLGGPLGWVCLGGAKWANFGIID